MILCHTPAKLPPHVTEEEKIALERGRELLQAMIDVVRKASAPAQDLPPREGGDHA